jgi:hypothetical protein
MATGSKNYYLERTNGGTMVESYPAAAAADGSDAAAASAAATAAEGDDAATASYARLTMSELLGKGFVASAPMAKFSGEAAGCVDARCAASCRRRRRSSRSRSSRHRSHRTSLPRPLQHAQEPRLHQCRRAAAGVRLAEGL